MSDIDSPSLSLSVVDLSSHTKRHGYSTILNETWTVLNARNALTQSAGDSIADALEDLQWADEDDLKDIGTASILTAVELLSDAGLKGYQEDGFFYIEDES